jgi:hypothetical protein
VFFIAFALIAAVLLLPGAKGSQAPLRYVCILGGLFVGIPAALGIGVVVANLRKRRGVRPKDHPNIPYSTRSMHYEKAPRFRRSKLDVAPASATAAWK